MSVPAIEEPKVIHHHHYISSSSPGIAVLLEVIPGLFFQVFGIGNLYAGNIALGLILMFSYWALLVVNVLLCFILIGFITLPLTLIGYLVVASISAHSAAVEKERLQQMRSSS